jgi:hypothetical protein
VALALALVTAAPVIVTMGAGPAGATPIGAHAARAVAAPAQAPSEPRVTAQPTPTPTPTAEPTRHPARTGLARAAADAAEDAAAESTDIGVAVLDRATGQTAVAGRGSEPYYTASLSKVVLAVDVLDRGRRDGLAASASASDLSLIRRALGPSDDNAMNALWSRFDGADAADRMSDRLGLARTSGPRDPSQWGEMSVPATDTVRIWQHILDEMPAADRDVLISAMAAAPARANDGFDQSYGLLSPAVDGPGGPGAVAKQGWMCCFSGKYYMHSTGAVGADQRFLVALLTRVPRGPGWGAARQELTRIATAAVQALG